MVSNRFRHISDKLVEKPAEILVKKKIAPNLLSILGFITSIIAAICFMYPKMFLYNAVGAWIPVMLFLLAGYFDVLDGAVARKGNRVSKFGGFLDSTLDRLSDAAILMGITFSGIVWPSGFPGGETINYLLGYLAVVFTLLVSYTRSRAENEGVVMKGIGLMERADRFIFLMTGYILESALWFYLNFLPPIAGYNVPFKYSYWLFPIFFVLYIILCMETVIRRIIHTKRWIEGKLQEDYLIKHKILEAYEEYLKREKEK